MLFFQQSYYQLVLLLLNYTANKQSLFCNVRGEKTLFFSSNVGFANVT